MKHIVLFSGGAASSYVAWLVAQEQNRKDDEFIATATYVKDEGFELWADSGEVIAWMPMPTPYEPCDLDWSE